MKVGVWMSLVVATLFGALSASAEDIANNLQGDMAFAVPANPGGTAPLEPIGQAQSFVLGSGGAYQLSAATALIDFNGSGPNTVTASLWDNSRKAPIQSPWPWLGLPGDRIATLGSYAFSVGAPSSAVVTFSATEPVVLEPQHGYWLLLSYSDPSSSSLSWAAVNAHTSHTYLSTGTGGFTWAGWGNFAEDGQWDIHSMSVVYLTSVEGVAAVPEPRAGILFLLGAVTAVALRRGQARLGRKTPQVDTSR